MSLTLLPPLQPPSPPRPPRRTPFSLHFLPLSSASSIPSTSPVFTPAPSQEWPQLHHTTPDSPRSANTVSVYSTPLTAPQSPTTLPAWKAVPPTPPAFYPLSPPSCPPVRRRTHPRPASAILSGTDMAATKRRLSLPARVMRTAVATSPPSAFRTHERRSSLGSAARKLFHIESDDAVSDGDDDTPLPPTPLGQPSDEPIPKRSLSQRQHALLELLMSERTYLADLRVLVNVYLEQLPILVSPKALTLPLLSPSYSATFAFGRPEEALRDKERDKDREKRSLLSDTELSAIRRNAAKLLELHETLSPRLDDAVRASGWVTGLHALEGTEDIGSESSNIEEEDAEERFESALRNVAELFTTQATLFNVYEVFCAEHPGALEIVKNLRHKRPVEWDAFERHCTTLIAANLACADGLARGGAVEEDDEVGRSKEQQPSHSVRHPTFSSDEQPPLLRGHPRSNQDLRRAAGTVGRNARKENPTERDPRLRLQFTDYLIKPVQRICKYPLLLNALTYERKPQLPTEADAVVMNAKQAMMNVAALVDNANLSHLQLQQTSRIGTRLSAPAAVLTFIRTLSTCVLAGSLDVVRAPALKAKYLAAFLYDGGFLVLAKVNRGPRYELRYWFSLEGFELNDANNDDPLLPYSFRLCNHSHEFEIAASCQREKQVWIDALRACLAGPPAWPPGTAPSNLEPAPAAIENSPLVDDQGPSLPTIQSNPQIEGSNKQGSPSSPVLSQRPTPATRTELPSARGLSEPPPSRRESTASLKSIFGLDPDVITVTRASLQARATVDALLEDVFSTACHSARSYAEAHSEALFHVAPTFGAAARSRLTKRESVVVRRRKSFIDLVDQAQALRSARKVQPDKGPPALALECVTSVEGGLIPLVQSPADLFDSPTVTSRCSSVTGSRGSSSATSPLADALELPLDSCSPSSLAPRTLERTPGDLLTLRELPPKRSRSLVDNFRGFILPNSNPPVRTLSVTRLPALHVPSTPPSPSQRRLWRDSLRRRSRSSPFVPADIPDPIAAAAIARHQGESAASATLSPATAMRHTWNLEELPTEETSTPSPTRRRTIFSSSSPRLSPTPPRNMLRSIIASFSRSSSTSMGQDL
ncbi:hypothetical protein EI94DRAFT_1718174 [Lactarius quietus]|nr:hypothetical protein EI94DRAFT_1718174 [Lactarius quietus]